MPDSKEVRNQRKLFFNFLFGDLKGWLSIAHANTVGGRKNFGDEYFPYPSGLEQALDYIEAHMSTNDMWFCAQLLKDRRRRKSSVIQCNSIWADLDACPPEKLKLKPSIVVESSANRYQAYWRLDEPVDAELAEDVARRIAYHYAPFGADRSGWDLTQLLRIPTTYNFKYPQSPIVTVKEAEGIAYSIQDFTNQYPQVEEYIFLERDLPAKLPGTAKKILEKVESPWVGALFAEKPDGDWSSKLWELERLLLESGLTAEETYAVCLEAACNKYKRDKRPTIALWKEILKAESKGVVETADEIYEHPLSSGNFQLLTDTERQLIEQQGNWVEEYTAWAETMTDADPDYHRVGAFIILSSLLSDSIRIDTDFKQMYPNLWAMIVADSTFTRKSTSMELVLDFIFDCDSDLLIATDGSTEGIFARVHEREGMVSMFYRDEFTGLLSSVSNKSYQAGLLQQLVLMYDNAKQKRSLKNEIMFIKNSIFLMYCGSVKTSLMDLMTEEHVTTGFVPRFIFIMGRRDPSRFRRIRSSTVAKQNRRDALQKKFQDLHKWYTSARNVFQVSPLESQYSERKIFTAQMNSEAEELFEKYNLKMLMAAESTSHKYLYEPMMGRLSMSGLKMAALLAATRMDEKLVITADDIKAAFFYIERWIPHSVEVVEASSTDYAEKLVRKVRDYLEEKGTIPLSEMSSVFRLSKKQTRDLLDTLALRGWAQSTGQGHRSKVSFVKGAK